jgi:hypothetical protein
MAWSVSSGPLQMATEVMAALNSSGDHARACRWLLLNVSIEAKNVIISGRDLLRNLHFL